MMFHEIAPFEFHNEYQKDAEAKDTDIFLYYQERSVLARDSETVAFPTISELKAGLSEKEYRLTYLFSISGVQFFTDIESEITGIPGFDFRRIDTLRQALPKHLAYAGVTGHQLFSWYKRTSFCGSCGEKAEHDRIERAMRCPKCNMIYYPMIAPSVIVGVTHGDRLLVTKYAPAHTPHPHYALVAGYIETGETPEEAVKREVMEEVGLKVKNIRYYKSQPWPFSGSLLLGYYCDLDGDETIKLDENELSEGLFMNREDLPDRSREVALTSEMIQVFKENKNN